MGSFRYFDAVLTWMPWVVVHRPATIGNGRRSSAPTMLVHCRASEARGDADGIGARLTGTCRCRTSSSSSAPRLGGDGRDEDRRVQDHQLPSLAAGEIQAGGAAGAIKSPLPQSASSTRGRGECPHDLACCACKSSRESAVGRLAVAESTKVSQLHSAMGPFTSPCIYL